MTQEIKLPDPDTHCWDDDSSKDVWSYSPELVRQIIEADRAQRGEPVAWIWRFPDGGLHETLFGTLVECERDAIGYAGSAIPLYTALAAQQTAPAWHDAPDKPGIWLCDEGDICYTWTAHSIEILDIKPEDDARWFGPIPPDGDTK